jgi:similar to stage IV sporulation protein
MSLYQSINGMIRVSLTSADPAGALYALNQGDLMVHHARIDPDEITLHILIKRQDLKKLRILANRKGYELKITGHIGIHWAVKRALGRPVLMTGIALLLFLTFFLPTRVLFFRVEGNDSVPTRLILEKCEEAGIYFGAPRREIRSEKVKNQLLASIDQLQWVGINTKGCVATITVRERSVVKMEAPPQGVSSIIADRDGVILSCTATSGSLQCRVGQQVQKGEVLISGYTDCGIAIRASAAQGEIIAQTNRFLEVLTLTDGLKFTEKAVITEKYALRIGKKRINFYKGSGISGTTCDKIYEENYMTLPGGFQLPVAVIKETWILREEEPLFVSEEESRQILRDFVTWYLPSQMRGGAVLDVSESVYFEDGYARLLGDYLCSEMIGQIRNEEIITPYGNDQ